MIGNLDHDRAKAQQYYPRLDEFVRVCEQLVDRGLAYWAVILCHELYRFLYPVEPYADWKAEKPVEFIAQHIERLLDTAKNIEQVVAPYSIDLTVFKDGILQDASLEKATSSLYSVLWRGFDTATLTEEGLGLLKRRLPEAVIANGIVGKQVLDVGCGSGRYSIALAKVGAKRVVGVDWQSQSFAAAAEWCRQHNLAVEFRQGDVLNLPFEAESFDFVFCNGVIHHTSSIERGLQELGRVLKKSGKAFLYLYAAGGIFWTTRAALRQVFKKIPLAYTQQVLHLIGMPSNRFIFCDTWYVPVETHTTQADLHAMLERTAFRHQKIVGQNPFDLDGAIDRGIPGGRVMWGDGEHRYILEKV